MASLDEQLNAFKAKRDSGANGPGSLAEQVQAFAAKRSGQDRGLVSQETADQQVTDAAGGAPIFHMDTSGQSFVNGKPASSMDLLRGMVSGNFQVPDTRPNSPEVSRQTGPFEGDDRISQGFVQANRNFGEENPVTGLPSRAIDFLENTPEGNRAVGEMAAGGLAGLAGGGPLAIGAAEGLASLAANTTFAPTDKPFTDAAITGGLAGGLDKGAQLGMAGLNRLRRGGTELLPGARKAIEQLDRSGNKLTPGLVTKNRLVDTIERISEKSLFGGGRIGRQRETTELAAAADLEKFVEAIVGEGGREFVGEVASKTISGNTEAWKAASSVAHRKVDGFTSSASVHFEGVIERLDDVIEQARLGLRKPEVEAIATDIRSKIKEATTRDTGLLDAAGRAIIEEVPADFRVSFETADALRSDLLKIDRMLNEPVAGAARTAAKRLAPEVDRAMELAADSLDPEAKAAWRTAKEIWKSGSEVFNTDLMRALARKEPEAFYQASIRSLQPGTIRNVKEAIADPVVWDQIKGQWMLELLDNSRSEGKFVEGIVPHGAKIKKGFDKFGREAINELIPDPKQREQFIDMANTLSLAQGTVGKDVSGGIFIQLQQAAAAYGIIFTNASLSTKAAMAPILVGPAIASRVLTNKAFNNWVTIGRKAKPGSDTAIRAFTNMGTIVAREKQLESRRRTRERDNERAKTRRKNARSINTPLPPSRTQAGNTAI